MKEAKPEMVRVNTRISLKANEWLDEESRKTGVPKSTLILLAIENYIQQRQTFEMMGDMGLLLDKLNAIEKAVKE